MLNIYFNNFMSNIIITVPHSKCLKEYHDKDIIYKAHLCDFRTKNIGEMFKRIFEKHNFNTYLYVNNNIPRICVNLKDEEKFGCCDLNRKKCRNNDWRKDVTKKMKELKNKKVFIIDIHSFNRYNSFGGCDVAILMDKNINSKINKNILELKNKINSILIQDNNYCNLFYGKNNDIIDQANELNINNFLLEVIEDENRLTNNIIEKMCDTIALHIKDMKQNGGNKKYKLVK